MRKNEAKSYETTGPSQKIGSAGSSGSVLASPRRRGPTYAAQGADAAGERQAQVLAAVVPGVERWRPTGGKDWNEALALAPAQVGWLT